MDDFEKFYNKALRFLSFRPRSEKEVRNYLEIKNQKSKIKNAETIVDSVIAKLKKKKFINDEEFAKWWIESRTRFKPRAIKLIILELKQKGISQDTIDVLTLNSELRTENDLDQAKKLIEKRIEKHKNLPKQEIYQKLGGLLARKGFNWDTIKKSIDEVIAKRV